MVVTNIWGYFNMEGLFSSSFIIIVTYYLGMLVWAGCIYRYRDTFKLVKNILLEVKYANGEVKEIPENVKEWYNLTLKNVGIMLGINLVFGLFSAVFVAILGWFLFILICLPLALMLYGIILLMGYYNTINTTDVHKPTTWLG